MEPINSIFPNAVTVCNDEPLFSNTITVSAELHSVSDSVTVSGEVPQAEYMHGCTPTAVGMLLGYYDYYGYMGYNVSNLIDGEVELNARGLDGDKYDQDAFGQKMLASILVGCNLYGLRGRVFCCLY